MALLVWSTGVVQSLPSEAMLALGSMFGPVNARRSLKRKVHYMCRVGGHVCLLALVTFVVVFFFSNLLLSTAPPYSMHRMVTAQSTMAFQRALEESRQALGNSFVTLNVPRTV